MACQETLRSALVLGTDRAILVNRSTAWEPLNIAKVLKAIVQRELPCWIGRTRLVSRKWCCRGNKPVLPAKWMVVERLCRWIY